MQSKLVICHNLQRPMAMSPMSMSMKEFDNSKTWFQFFFDSIALNKATYLEIHFDLSNSLIFKA